MVKLSVLLTILVPQSWAVFPLHNDKDKPRCPDVGSRCIENGSPSRSEFQYRVDGQPINVVFQDGRDLKIPCSGSLTLDNEALPRFPRRVTVQSVFLEECPAPNNSIAVTLAALNVTTYTRLVMDNLPTEPPLRKEHFSNLKISVLYLGAVKKVTFEPGLLSDLNLTQLRLKNIYVDKLPVGLTALTLDRTGISPLRTEVVRSLQELVFKEKNMTDIRELENATQLRRLILQGHVDELPAMPSLKEFMIDGWMSTEPRPWIHCSELRVLTVASANVLRLPDAWLAACQRLEKLDLFLYNLEALSPHLFRGAVNIRELTIQGGKFKELPVELFESIPQLKVLNLAHNLLKDLPSGIFSKSTNIIELNLSYNKLSADNLNNIANLLSLQVLTLSNNPLGRLCDEGSAAIYVTGATSPLSTLIELRKLTMIKAEIPDLCYDWLTKFPYLTTLDLRNNLIKKLRYEKLITRAPTEIDLRGNNITHIAYSSNDCTAVVKGPRKPSAGIIKINSKLKCNCHLYNFALALKEEPKHVNIETLQCSDDRDLRDIPVNDLYCELSPPGDCVPGCVCQMIPSYNSSHALSCDFGFGVRARCEGKALPSLYALPGNMDPLELTVTGLEDLSVLKLDGQLQKINLENNNISSASPSISRLLLSRGRQVKISGNPLDCTCGKRYLVEELLKHSDKVENFLETQCSDTRFLKELTSGDCSLLPSGAIATLGVLAAAAFSAMVLTAVLISPELRLRFKIYLYKFGITLPCINDTEEDEVKRYDAFISFSHHDGRLVVEQIVPVLEKDYQLCLHYRDWPIGGWIPEQIATSVRDSRRTIIVVSENYAKSDWARAEFREAHATAMRDSRPRLLAILLEEPPPELDPDLKLYLSTNTYVKWGDPAFWDKLRYAMPRKRTKNFLPESA